MLRILEDSSNVDAEQCLRVLGAQTRRDGSLAGGMAAMRVQLRRLVGALPDNCKLIDGSGLSAANRATPALIARTLHRAKAQPFFPTLFQALPIAARTGSLDDRFVGTPLAERVHAKTGWILGASSL